MESIKLELYRSPIRSILMVRSIVGETGNSARIRFSPILQSARLTIATFSTVYLVSFHSCLQRVDGINLRDDDATTEGSQTLRASLANVSVSGHHAHFAGDHDVGRSLDTVDQRFSASVQIVELALIGNGVNDKVNYEILINFI